MRNPLAARRNARKRLWLPVLSPCCICRSSGGGRLGRGAGPARAHEVAIHRHGADPPPSAGEVAPVGPHDPAVEEQLQPLRVEPCRTGKSHIDKEISPNSIVVSGGQTPVVNLFYNMARRKMGGRDVVAFEKAARIFLADKDGIQIIKDHMISGSDRKSVV